jgi:hypothetical protein
MRDPGSGDSSKRGADCRGWPFFKYFAPYPDCLNNLHHSRFEAPCEGKNVFNEALHAGDRLGFAASITFQRLNGSAVS